MWNIVIGVIFIIGGLSGRVALLGTRSPGALVVVGVILVLWGLSQVRKKG
ncbi:MAG: hypothetical protein NTW87_30970 [Planctomycetota bacterium]|nr:hypothetical protein [Planctomycetota bacterium]